jgi:hypothetical protein
MQDDEPSTTAIPVISPSTGGEPLTTREVWNSWLPLAASWLLMGAELPLLSAVVARLPDPAVNLAAYGGVVFPVALIIEAPIIMLLAASTALSRDWSSYRKLRAFMVQAGALLTGLHVLVAFTPLHDVVARDWIGAPEEVIEPARWGLMMMTPWTWAIASRRFHQGVLIRFGHSGAVWRGTVIRLLANAVVLAGGYLIGTIPGILVATAAVILGVTRLDGSLSIRNKSSRSVRDMVMPHETKVVLPMWHPGMPGIPTPDKSCANVSLI